MERSYSEMEKEMGRNSRSESVFIAIIVLAMVIVGAGMVAVYRAGVKGTFGGELEEVGLLQVSGTLVRAESFEVFLSDGTVSFKHLWLIKVEQTTPVEGHDIVLPDVTEGDFISCEVKDSRANLFLNFVPQECYRADGSSVRVCEYEVIQEGIVMIVREDLSDSSILPEFSGVPR